MITPKPAHSLPTARPRVIHRVHDGLTTVEVPAPCCGHRYTVSISWNPAAPEALVDVAIVPIPCTASRPVVVLAVAAGVLRGLYAAAAARGDSTGLALWQHAGEALQQYAGDYMMALDGDAGEAVSRPPARALPTRQAAVAR